MEMLISALYNLVDALFVEKNVGPAAIAALTIVLPVQIMMLAIGFMTGAGCASIISRALGISRKNFTVRAAGWSLLWVFS